MGTNETSDSVMQTSLKLMGRESYGFPADTTCTDEDGNTVKYGLVNGRIVPPFGRKYIERVKDFEIREDDILLCGYPKTGCHWTWEILRMIVNDNDQCTEHGKGTAFLELAAREAIESPKSPRVLNSHLWFDMLPTQIKDKKTKMVLTTRNPKDTAVSFYNHVINLKSAYDYNGKFSSWLKLFFDGKVEYGDFVSYHLDWYKVMRENPSQPIYVTSYENMKEDLPREIRAMAKFLEVDLTEDKVTAIAKAAGIDNMRKAYSSISSKLIRKGQVGDWRNWLTVAESERFDEDIDKKLTHTSFKFRYSLE